MQIDFEQLHEEMKIHGMPVPKQRHRIAIDNSKEIMKNTLQYFVGFEGKNAEWIEQYDQVADWLSDSKGRGLFMYGDCGLGKSLLGRYVLPAIILKYSRKVVSVYSMSEVNKLIDQVISMPFISLDDVGVEEVINDFGNKRSAFAEIIDEVEKKGKMIIISTNLQVRKYGDRIMERIISTTYRVKFYGKSLRK